MSRAKGLSPECAMFWRSWILSAVKIFTPRRPREIVTYHCCSICRGGDRRVRKQNVIHGFALSGVGRDRVAAHELAIIFWQRAAIIQGNAPVRMNLFHRDQFAIGKFASVLAFAIGFELQPLASGQAKFFRLANRDSFQIFERNRPDAIAGFDKQMFVQ